MTIREVEQRSGMERASIRYYEQEGLLTPRRGENGYRDYSEEDLDTLLRVRFLRSLGFSLEQIRAFQKGETPLYQALDERIQSLSDEQKQKEQACRICQAMQRDQAEYATLDWEKYQRLPAESGQPAPVIHPPQSDVLIEELPCPWRRWLARYLDRLLGGAFLTVLIALVRLLGGHDPVLTKKGTETLLQWLPSLFGWLIEPFFLHWLGATPAKAILGLRVEAPEGGRLSLRAAWKRTWMEAWYGEGLNIPIYALIREIISYRRCKRGEILPWEEDNVLVVRPVSLGRGLLYPVVFAAALGVSVAFELFGTLPPCRGEVTVAQFARNYNALSYYHGLNGGRLTETGEWEGASRQTEDMDGGITIDLGARFTMDIDYDLREDGAIRALTWRCAYDPTDGWMVALPVGELTIASLSYAGAAGGLDAFSSYRLVNFCSRFPFGEQFTVNGLAVDYQMSGEEGYFISQDGACFPRDDTTTPLEITLQINQAGSSHYRRFQ